MVRVRLQKCAIGFAMSVSLYVRMYVYMYFCPHVTA
jgi:hypothetical protein